MYGKCRVKIVYGRTWQSGITIFNTIPVTSDDGKSTRRRRRKTTIHVRQIEILPGKSYAPTTLLPYRRSRCRCGCIYTPDRSAIGWPMVWSPPRRDQSGVASLSLCPREPCKWCHVNKLHTALIVNVLTIMQVWMHVRGVDEMSIASLPHMPIHKGKSINIWDKNEMRK